MSARLVVLESEITLSPQSSVLSRRRRAPGRFWLALALLLGSLGTFGACGHGGHGEDPAARLAPASLDLLRSPSKGGAANRLQPWIRWNSAPGADRYLVRLFEDEARTRELASIETAELSWQLPFALEDGRAYYTDLRVLRSDGAAIAIDQGRFRVREAPAWLPGLLLTVDDRGLRFGGPRLLNIFDLFNRDARSRVACLAVINGAGEYLWWYRAEDASDLLAARQAPNGNLLFVHRVQRDDWSVTSKAVEIDWAGRELWSTPADLMVHHDVGPGPFGAYLALCWSWRSYANESYEGDALRLLDPQTGEVLWSWDIFDHFDPIRHPTPDMDTIGRSFLGQDWSHGNAAVWDERRGLIWLCARNLDSLIGIEFPSGRVRTVIGRHGLGGPELLSHPHAPEIQEDGSILVFDNGNTRPEPYSRVVELLLNEDDTAVRTGFVWEGRPRFYDPSMGDVDRLPNGNYLVTAGQSARLLELTPGGDICWELLIDQSERPRWTYRCTQLHGLPAEFLPFGESRSASK